MVSAWYVRGAASAYTDWLDSETNRNDGRCATRPIPERRPNRKATVSDGGNNSIAAENSSPLTIQISVKGLNLSAGTYRWQMERRP
jgi:hypothetical protein